MVDDRIITAHEALLEELNARGGAAAPRDLQTAMFARHFSAFEVQEAIQLGLSRSSIRLNKLLQVEASKLPREH